MRDRLEELENLEVSYHIQVANGQATIYGEFEDDIRGLYVLDLMEDFAKYLPDLTFHTSAHDAGNGIIGEDTRLVIAGLNRVGRGKSLSVKHLQEPADLHTISIF